MTRHANPHSIRSGAMAIAFMCCGFVSTVHATEIVIYGFEESAEGWAIPDWAKSSADYVATGAAPSQRVAEEGQSSLEIQADFPGGRWVGAYVERQAEVTDWADFHQLFVSLYVPKEAPDGLEARIVLTVGDTWKWTEMNHGIALKPGAWTTIGANLTPVSTDWKFFPDEHFRKNIKRIGVRIESNKQPVYRGSVFLDNIRLSE